MLSQSRLIQILLFGIHSPGSGILLALHFLIYKRYLCLNAIQAFQNLFDDISIFIIIIHSCFPVSYAWEIVFMAPHQTKRCLQSLKVIASLSL